VSLVGGFPRLAGCSLCRAWNDGQTRLPQPADDYGPVPAQAVLVHCMCALNRCAVMAADNSRSSGSALKGPPDRVCAGCANVENAVRFHLAFLESFASAMIDNVQGGLIHLWKRSRMPDDDPVAPASKKPQTPLIALRMDKTAFSVISLKDSRNDKEFWRTQSTAARLHAREFMRQVM
jgi:hypothetical protein